jgi:hypothetical protein
MKLASSDAIGLYNPAQWDFATHVLKVGLATHVLKVGLVLHAHKEKLCRFAVIWWQRTL